MIKLFIALLILFFVTRLYIDHNMLKISKFSIKNSKIGSHFEGFRILQLSDLHSKSFGKNNEKLVKEIDKIKPDIIVITGDAVNGNESDFHVFYGLIDQIVNRYKVYYIKGNHEENLSKKRQAELMDYLSHQGVVVLNNEKATITKESDKINLYGIWSNYKYQYAKSAKGLVFTENTMRKTMHETKAEKGVFNILLAHNPNMVDAYTKWGADLVLSGHIHGGMIRLPIIGGIFSPDTRVFPKYSKGEYHINGKTLIVSTGLHRGMRGFRLFNRPQINVILLSGNQK